MVNVKEKSAQNMIDLCWNMTLVLAVFMCTAIFSDAANASDAITIVFCNVVDLLSGTTGRAIATVAVIAVGVGALLGKISWGMALIVACGVALVFGAGTIVTALGASDSTSCGAAQSFSTQGR